MTKTKILIGTKDDIPAKYLDQYYSLRQLESEERDGFLPPEIEYYRNLWKIPTEIGQEEINSIITNEDDLVVGYGALNWNSKYDNLNKGRMFMYVVPDYRRRGIGTQLIKKMLDLAPSQIEILSFGVVVYSDGEQFIRRLIPSENYEQILYVANLEDFENDEILLIADTEKKSALEKGYEIIQMFDLGFPEVVDADEFTRVVEQIWNDMPRGQMSDEDEILTVERFKSLVQRYIDVGYKQVTFIAVETKTNNPVGFTSIAINNHQPSIAKQLDTGVIHEHRGHGLGLALKYQALNFLISKTSAKYWATANAESNTHIHNINLKLKHKIWSKERIYQISRNDLEEKLGDSKKEYDKFP